MEAGFELVRIRCSSSSWKELKDLQEPKKLLGRGDFCSVLRHTFGEACRSGTSAGSPSSTGLEGTELVERKEEWRGFFLNVAGAVPVLEVEKLVKDMELGRKMLRLFLRRRSAMAVVEQVDKPCGEAENTVSIDKCIGRLGAANSRLVEHGARYSGGSSRQSQITGRRKHRVSRRSTLCSSRESGENTGHEGECRASGREQRERATRSAIAPRAG